MVLYYTDIQANRRETRLRRMNNLGHAAAMIVLVLATFLSGCSKKPVTDYNVNTATSAPIYTLGGGM